MLPDLAYLVHEADNELLRYSLRSIDTFASGTFGTVWIVGVKPAWAVDVELIPVAEPNPRNRFTSIRSKVTALCAHDAVADDVVILNDDYIATRPVTDWAPTHMGSTSGFLEREAGRGRTARGNSWIRAVTNTARWMADRGHGDIDCYEGHVPLMFHRRKLAKALADYPANLTGDYPGFYPEAGSGGPGVRALNAKIGPSADEFAEKINDPSMPGWLSTNDRGFAEGPVGRHIRALFPDPSRFEKG